MVVHVINNAVALDKIVIKPIENISQKKREELELNNIITKNDINVKVLSH